MNDKIYEFATRAGLITFESIHDSMAVTPSIESVAKARKFAELIVREFSKQVQIEGRFGLEREQTLIRLCCENAKKHFGVEE
jgi:hypothetical protein